MPFKKGNKIREGSTNKEAGRKPDWYKHWCREAIYKQSRLDKIEKFLDKGDFKEFWEVWKYLAEVGHGRPMQQMDVTYTKNEGEKIDADVLINTIAETRRELDNLRKSTAVDSGK